MSESLNIHNWVAELDASMQALFTTSGNALPYGHDSGVVSSKCLVPTAQTHHAAVSSLSWADLLLLMPKELAQPWLQNSLWPDAGHDPVPSLLGAHDQPFGPSTSSQHQDTRQPQLSHKQPPDNAHTRGRDAFACSAESIMDSEVPSPQNGPPCSTSIPAAHFPDSEHPRQLKRSAIATADVQGQAQGPADDQAPNKKACVSPSAYPTPASFPDMAQPGHTRPVPPAAHPLNNSMSIDPGNHLPSIPYPSLNSATVPHSVRQALHQPSALEPALNSRPAANGRAEHAAHVAPGLDADAFPSRTGSKQSQPQPSCSASPRHARKGSPDSRQASVGQAPVDTSLPSQPIRPTASAGLAGKAGGRQGDAPGSPVLPAQCSISSFPRSQGHSPIKAAQVGDVSKLKHAVLVPANLPSLRKSAFVSQPLGGLKVDNLSHLNCTGRNKARMGSDSEHSLGLSWRSVKSVKDPGTASGAACGDHKAMNSRTTTTAAAPTADVQGSRLGAVSHAAVQQQASSGPRGVASSPAVPAADDTAVSVNQSGAALQQVAQRGVGSISDGPAVSSNSLVSAARQPGSRAGSDTQYAGLKRRQEQAGMGMEDAQQDPSGSAVASDEVKSQSKRSAVEHPQEQAGSGGQAGTQPGAVQPQQQRGSSGKGGLGKVPAPGVEKRSVGKPVRSAHEQKQDAAASKLSPAVSEQGVSGGVKRSPGGKAAAAVHVSDPVRASAVSGIHKPDTAQQQQPPASTAPHRPGQHASKGPHRMFKPQIQNARKRRDAGAGKLHPVGDAPVDAGGGVSRRLSDVSNHPPAGGPPPVVITEPDQAGPDIPAPKSATGAPPSHSAPEPLTQQQQQQEQQHSNDAVVAESAAQGQLPTDCAGAPAAHTSSGSLSGVSPGVAASEHQAAGLCPAVDQQPGSDAAAPAAATEHVSPASGAAGSAGAAATGESEPAPGASHGSKVASEGSADAAEAAGTGGVYEPCSQEASAVSNHIPGASSDQPDGMSDGQVAQEAHAGAEGEEEEEVEQEEGEEVEAEGADGQVVPPHRPGTPLDVQMRVAARLAEHQAQEYASLLEAQRREAIQGAVRARLEKQHGRAILNNNLPRFLTDIGITVTQYTPGNVPLSRLVTSEAVNSLKRAVRAARVMYHPDRVQQQLRAAQAARQAEEDRLHGGYAGGEPSAAVPPPCAPAMTGQQGMFSTTMRDASLASLSKLSSQGTGQKGGKGSKSKRPRDALSEAMDREHQALESLIWAEEICKLLNAFDIHKSKW